MMADCRAGKVDRILVKSMSRFARNTRNTLYFMRLGVTVRFEKENIDTGKLSSEQTATIYAAFAQMESTGHSSNMENEASTVRRIFARYLMGQSVGQICRDLTAAGCKTARGGTNWSDYTVRYILENQKYMGDTILQKTFTLDLFSRQQVKNEGQLPKYYVENAHPAIIDRATFQMVQEEMARQTLADCIAAALAGVGSDTSLPAVETRLRALQEEQIRLFHLAADAGPENTEYDDRISEVNAAMTALLARKGELEQEDHAETECDSRVRLITDTLETTDSAIGDFDEGKGISL